MSYNLKNRVRDGGKTIQKRKRVSNQKGYTYDTATSSTKKIDALSRLRMSKSAKLSAKKKLSKKRQIDLKRKKSLRKRKQLGFT